MAIRLTKQMRSTILNSIMKATDFEKKEEKIRTDTKVEVHKMLLGFIPKSFSDMVNAAPKKDRDYFNVFTSITLDSTLSPNAVFKNYYIKEGYTATENIFDTHVPAYFNRSLLNDYSIMQSNLRVSDATPRLLALVEEAKELVQAKKDLRYTVENSLASYHTVEKLLKDYPEFTRHCPDKPPSYALVVDNAVTLSALFKNGFDIETKKATKVVTPVVASKVKPKSKVVK